MKKSLGKILGMCAAAGLAFSVGGLMAGCGREKVEETTIAPAPSAEPAVEAKVVEAKVVEESYAEPTPSYRAEMGELLFYRELADRWSGKMSSSEGKPVVPDYSEANMKELEAYRAVVRGWNKK